MADKLTPLIIDALARAAADPAGAPLYATKSEAGLFPNVSAAKPAAKKCLDDGLLQIARSDAKSKPTRELYAATDKGLNYLVEHASPKEVIDDFVRILEERRGEVRQLLTEARRIADGIEGLMGVVTRLSSPHPVASRPPSPPETVVFDDGGRGSKTYQPDSASVLGSPLPPSRNGTVSEGEGLGVRAEPAADLPALLLSALNHWHAVASVARDCPLSDLYHTLAEKPSIGEFHDALRQLHADGRIYLHPWTGPLYALPEPAFALLVGHEIAYYVSPR